MANATKFPRWRCLEPGAEVTVKAADSVGFVRKRLSGSTLVVETEADTVLIPLWELGARFKAILDEYLEGPGAPPVTVCDIKDRLLGGGPAPVWPARPRKKRKKSR